jgi:hypothetical protein
MKVKMSKNIESFKPKLMGGFTARQVVASVICLSIVIPIYIFLREPLGDDLTGWLVIFIAMPILAFGWLEFQGLPFEKFIGEIVMSEIIAPKIRPYHIEDDMEEFLKNYNEEDEETEES